MTSDYRGLFAGIIVCFSLAFALLIVGLANPRCIGATRRVRPTASIEAMVEPASSPTGAPASSTATLSDNRLRVVGKGTAFDKSSLQATAGALTIAFANQDAGVTHNFHLFKGSDPSGESVAMTPITPGPDTQTLAVDIAVGAYFYHCDVHPLQMTGTLTVQ